MKWMGGWSWNDYWECPEHYVNTVLVPMMNAEAEAIRRVREERARGSGVQPWDMPMPPAETAEDVVRIIEGMRANAAAMENWEREI
jgi:hypothetical protein